MVDMSVMHGETYTCSINDVILNWAPSKQLPN